jgi:hypothetical protein
LLHLAFMEINARTKHAAKLKLPPGSSKRQVPLMKARPRRQMTLAQ